MIAGALSYFHKSIITKNVNLKTIIFYRNAFHDEISKLK